MNACLKKEPLYILSGTVVHGKGIGKSFDMPTANLDLSNVKELPPAGVYITEITLRGDIYLGVTNVGTRPTVDDDKYITVEAHILDFNDNIYGETIKLRLFDVLRNPQKFKSVDMLKKQFLIDCQSARDYFNQN